MTTREKMISMVDFDTLMGAFKVAVGDKKIEEKINPEIVRKYLEKWAEAKENLFVLFGEKLTLSQEVDFVVDTATLLPLIHSLYTKFPAYAATLNAVDSRDWVNNAVSGYTQNGTLGILFPDVFKKGTKVSKALSTVLQDEQFDIELSKFLQNRTVKGQATVSIHPLDYATLSTNTHHWGSCMSLIEGFNKSGCFSLMIDPDTMVAFQCRNDTVTYKNAGGSFDWNNKIFRQLLIFNEERTAFAFGHYNGTPDPNTQDTWKDLVTSCLPDLDWSMDKGDSGYGYASKAGHFYYDTSYYKQCVTKGAKRQYKLGVEELWCVICGKPFTEIIQNKGYLCHKEEL